MVEENDGRVIVSTRATVEKISTDTKRTQLTMILEPDRAGDLPDLAALVGMPADVAFAPDQGVIDYRTGELR